MRQQGKSALPRDDGQKDRKWHAVNGGASCSRHVCSALRIASEHLRLEDGYSWLSSIVQEVALQASVQAILCIDGVVETVWLYNSKFR